MKTAGVNLMTMTMMTISVLVLVALGSAPTFAKGARISINNNNGNDNKSTDDIHHSPPPPVDPTRSSSSSAAPPGPAPEFVNLTELLTLSGPFHSFLSHLESTSVLQTFQNEANNSQHGITIFVPQDKAFSSLKNPSLSKLSKDQLTSLLLYHALPKFYALADFNDLSGSNPVPTYAGGSYTLNFTYSNGDISVKSGWSDTRISSSVLTSDPVAVYQVDKVLLPQAIFGTAPPHAAPAPGPAASKSKSKGPSAAANATDAASEPSSSSSKDDLDGISSSSHMTSCAIFSYLLLAAAAAGFLVFL